MTKNSERAAMLRDLVEGWRRFVSLLEADTGLQLLNTAIVVDALVGRSILAREIEGGAQVQPDTLAQTDEAFRRLAAPLATSTRVRLYEHGQPDRDWWWHVWGQDTSRVETFDDVATIARSKGVHANTVRAAIASGELRARRLGRGFLAERRDVDSWQPRGRGRPKLVPSKADRLLEAFNRATVERDFAAAHEFAEEIAASANTGRRCLALAIDAYNQGEDEAALAWLERASEFGLEPKAEARSGLVRGLALVRMGQPLKAVTVLSSVRSEPAERWRVQSALADALLAAGDGLEATTVLESAIRERPDIPELRFQAGRLHFHEEHPARALPHILAFRSTDPGDPAGLLLHGSILGRLGDLTSDDELYREAIQLFQTAATYDPVAASSKLALAYGRLGDWRSSVDSLAELPVESAVGRDSLMDGALLGVALRGDVTDTADAAAYAEKRGLRSQLTRTFIALGQALAGNPDAALRVLEDDLPADEPAVAEVDALAGLAFVAAGKPAAAIPRLRRFANRQHGAPFAKVLCGYAAAAAGEVDLAISAIHLIREEDSELGRLADLSVYLLEQQAKELSRQSVVRAGLRSFEPSTSAGLAERLPWDVGDRLVSAINDRSVARGTPA